MGNNSDNRIKKRTDIITDELNQYERVQRDADSKYAWEIKKAKPTFKQVLTGAIIISAIIIAIAIVCSAPKKSSTNTNSPEIVTISTLQKIVNVSKLSTVKFVYNGSTNVSSGNKTDYYVSYKSIVSVGVDFDKISLEQDSEAKKIYVTIPPPEITDTSVDIESLDFIFNNKKANELSALQTAYEKCVEDVRNECKSNDKMFDLAQKGIEDTIRALTQPIIDELFDGYELEFRKG